MSDMGAYIKQRREALGLTQAELARRAGVHRERISWLENRASFAEADVRRKVAAGLGVRHVDLIVAAGHLHPDEVPAGSDRPLTPEQALLDRLSPEMRDQARQYLAMLLELDERRAREARAGAPVRDPGDHTLVN